MSRLVRIFIIALLILAAILGFYSTANQDPSWYSPIEHESLAPGRLAYAQPVTATLTVTPTITATVVPTSTATVSPDIIATAVVATLTAIARTPTLPRVTTYLAGPGIEMHEEQARYSDPAIMPWWNLGPNSYLTVTLEQGYRAVVECRLAPSSTPQPTATAAPTSTPRIIYAPFAWKPRRR